LQRTFFDLPNGRLSALRFGDPGAPLRLVFCHANGFNAQSYSAILDPLNVHAIALDLRGHGLTTLPTDPARLANWQIFADDIKEFFAAHVSAPTVVAGHSYGAVSAILALPNIRDKVSGYVGFDPVLVPAPFRILARAAFWRAHTKRRLPIARKAGQRKAVFDSLEEAFSRYQGRGAFRGVSDPTLRDYLEGGLIETDEGQVRLACDPSWEQAIYTAQGHNAFRNIPQLPDNSKLVFAGGYGRVSTASLRRAVQRLQPRLSVEFGEDLTHLFPLQQPEFATDVLRDVLSRTEPEQGS